MKRFIFALGLLSLLAGCAKEQPASEAVTPAGGTILKASLEDLKTSINGVKISWSQGDAICVNGAASRPITAAGAQAVFTFESQLQAPYKAVYPASLYKDANTLSLPSVWANFNVPLLGYLASGDNISFQSFTSIIKLSVKADEAVTLASVSLKALGDEQVCGDFTVNYQTGVLTGVSTSPADTAVTVMVNQALSADPITVYVPVPAGTYSSGYDIEFTDSQGRTMPSKVSARTLAAGELRIMDPVTFVPGGAPVVIGGIRDAQDFLEFAAAVNAGASTARWENASGWVTLLDDIDFTGVSSWTPVGNATAPWESNVTAPLPDGQPAFTGKFDGNAHHIKNLHLTDAGTVAGQHFGLFGYVKGGTVQNFTIDESCSLTVSSSVSHSVGMIAGVVCDAEVRDVTSYAPMTYQGGATGYFHMALIGGIYGDQTGTTVDSVHNRGEINVTNTANLNAGATALHVAGVVGFAGANTGNNRVAECNNFGAMNSQAGRTSGIVAAANKNTAIVGCINYGNQTNTMPKNDGARLGNICCYTNANSVITECVNYGNLVSTTAGRVGGIVSLPCAGTYSSNENYGEVISDSQYRGVYFGYVTANTTWSGKASGKVGQYNGGTYEYDVYTESEKVKYLGKVGGTATLNADAVVIDIQTGEPQPDPSLDVDADFRIFFIGNSFTKDAVEHLPGIVHAAGLNRIQMVHMYYGGRTIPEYNDGWSTSTDYTCYVCNPGESSWSTLTGKSLAQVAATGKWDVVTIQEHTGRRLAWGWSAAEKEAVQGLMGKVLAAQAMAGGSPKLYYILSQAYQDLSKAQSGTKPFSTTEQMWEIIATQGETCVDECTFNGVISTGAMLQNLRTSSINNADGLTRDGYHMDYGISRYGAACTVFESVIGPFNGNVKLDDNTYRYSASGTAVTNENAPIALQAARYAIAKPYEVTDMSGGGPGPDPQPVVINISDATQLLAFAARVNAGEAEALTAEVNLTADIDCSGITDWTPIGTCTLGSWAYNALTPSGNLFRGTFDGKNHIISNLKMSFTPTEGNHAWGFFGGLGKGSIVKDVNFDATCSMMISTGVAGVFGTLAGLLVDGTVDNVTSRAAINGGGTASLANNTAAGRVSVGGVIGWVMARETATTASNLHNYGTIGSDTQDFVRGGNAGNGANGVAVGGVIGTSSNCNNTCVQSLSDLVNDGNIYTDAGRVSGIVSAANRYTHLSNCTNNGDVHYSASGTFRPANITCLAAEGSTLTDCTNTGDLIAPNSVSAAGVICLINADNVSLTRCHSLGATIVCSGFDTTTPKVTYAGVLFGQCNKAATFSACTVSGKVGSTEAGAVNLTAENYFTFVGQRGTSCGPTCNPDNITLAQ